MRSVQGVLWGTVLVVLGLVPPAVARTVTLREAALLREAATKNSALVGELPPRTTLEVTGEDAGWLKVEAPDGRRGYVWAAHVREASEESDTAPEVPRRPEPPAREPAAGGLTDTLNEIRAGVGALREGPAPASAEELAKLREAIERLAQGQQDLARRIEERAEPADVPLEGTGFAWAALVVGVFVGWILGLITRRRRARRQHDRIRL